MLNRVSIVAVQEGALSCYDEECLEEYDQDIDVVVCGQSARELVARVRAILRRREADVEANIQHNAGNLRMDLTCHEVLVNGHAVDLTPKEFKILKQFLESPRRVFSRQEMLNRVGGKAMRSKSTRLMCIFIRCGRRSSSTPPARHVS